MIKFIPADPHGHALSTKTGLSGEKTLITSNIRELEAHWRSAEITTATTTTVVTTKPGEAILITDLVVTLSKKVNNATIIPEFDDGTNTETFFTFDAGTSSFQFEHAFRGGLRGWEGADFKVVTNQNTNVSVLVGYVHLSKEYTLAYNQWVAER